MIAAPLRLTAWLMARVRVNRLERCDRDGARMVLKQRRWFGSLVIWFGNRFLALAGSRVRMFVRTCEWMAWEKYSFGLLYTDGPPAWFGPGPSVCLPQLPGSSLRRLLGQGDSCLAALAAGARELRRAHAAPCSFFDAGWSHGDLHLDNILYDRDQDRAFLIDFDTRHQPWVEENRRRADDLEVLLLELIAAPGGAWHPLATAFLREYGEATVLKELASQLVIPRGFARILWYTRTDCRPLCEIAPRVRTLQETIRQIISIAT